MADCCDPIPYRRVFDSREAARRLDRFRRRGLDDRAADVVAFLDDRVDGMTVLEVGGGVGDVQVALLEAGATAAVNVELSDAWEEAAAELARETGTADRVSRRLGDFVAIADDVEAADVVVLNRVVCCYPDMARMLHAAAASTRRFLAVVVPRERWWIRAAVTVGNRFLGLRGCGFRAFVHPVADMERIAADHGLSPIHRSQDLIWQSTVFERT
ncbi:MAG: methyltransferase domain-containing protein [Acidimicrobiia bacterium]